MANQVYFKNIMLTCLIIILIISIPAALLSVIIFIILIYTRVPFVKTPTEAFDQILSAVKINQGSAVYDLGCGDASFLIEVEKKTGAKTVGFEITPLAYLFARANVWRNQAKTKVIYKNFYRENLSAADVVFCFLIDSVMGKVGQQLKSQLHPGATVISYAFPIPNWSPVKVLTPFPNREKSSKIYIYRT